MAKLSIKDLDLKGKRAFVRVDFNVPIKDGRIGDDTRIRATLPTITYALEHGATVVLASEGYPTTPRTGDVIEGFEEASRRRGVTVFCSGVDQDSSGRLRTAGGRVLAVTGLGETITAARDRAYDAVSALSWPGMHHRRDIAANAAKDEA